MSPILQCDETSFANRLMVNTNAPIINNIATLDAYVRIVRDAPFGIYVIDADFRMAEVSAGCKSVFKNIDPLIGREFEEILRTIWAEPFASECIAHFRHTLTTGKTYQAAVTSKKRGDVNAEESYDWKVERVQMPDGRWGVVCYFYDLTERIQMEETLARSENDLRLALTTVQASEQFNRTVLESSPDCVKILDHEGLVEYVNENGACLLELDAPSDLLGKPWWSLWTEDTRQMVRDSVDRALGGEPSHFQAFCPTAKGTPKWWDVIVTTVPGVEGQSKRLISVSRDITESKLAEEALREVRDQLEVKVVERTAELEEAHAELVRVLREVVAVQETERQRISRDVHDHLGGSLTGLRLNLESLLRNSAEQPHLHSKIESLQKIAAGLDSDISYLAWMLRPAILDELGLVPALDCFVKEWSERFAVHTEFRAINVAENDLAPDIQTNLYRITQEALTNIAKHAGATSVNVIFNQAPESTTLVIEDNGKGFTHVITPEPSVTLREPKHGLGLHGMRDRARLIGASFQIESSADGTSIFVSIPSAAAHAA